MPAGAATPTVDAVEGDDDRWRCLAVSHRILAVGVKCVIPTAQGRSSSSVFGEHQARSTTARSATGAGDLGLVVAGDGHRGDLRSHGARRVSPGEGAVEGLEHPRPLVLLEAFEGHPGYCSSGEGGMRV